MIILEKNINKDVGNDEYNIKVKGYAKSSIGLTKSLADKFDQWSPKEIESRQTFLAKQAKNIWKIPGL